MEFSETQKVQKESQSLKSLTLFALFSYYLPGFGLFVLPGAFLPGLKLPFLTAPLPSFGFVDLFPILIPAGFLPLSANTGAARPAIAIVATNKAAAINKLMRLITLCVSFRESYPLDKLLTLRGLGTLCLCLVVTNKCSAPCPRSPLPNSDEPLPSSFASFAQSKTGHHKALSTLRGSRLHHWLCLSQVPICGTEFLASTCIVASCLLQVLPKTIQYAIPLDEN